MPRFAFAGRELDCESGPYYNRLRYYDAGTGRPPGDERFLKRLEKRLGRVLRL